MPVHDVTQTQPTQMTRRKYSPLWLLMGFFGVFLIVTIGLIGAYGGYQTAQQEHRESQATQAYLALDEQYELGLQDLESGRFDLARQRLEYVLEYDPEYPDAADKLLIVLQVLYATATPTPLPPTITPTATPDLRPIEELFTQAQRLYAAGDWDGIIDTLINLRKVDQSYRVVEVDSLIFRALWNRGIIKIRNDGNLEGGIYDLALAERFSPLDVEASKWRNLARVYMIGSSFWEVHPAQAVYYFGQVASASPYLRDSSGWTARERYRAALIQYGDMFARSGEWCEAQAQYELALEIYSDERVMPTATYLADKCSPPTQVPEDTPTVTLTSTITNTLVPGITPTDISTATETLIVSTVEATSTETSTPGITETPILGETSTPMMTDTPGVEVTPTPTISSTPKPQPTTTDTLPPPSATPTSETTPTPE